MRGGVALGQRLVRVGGDGAFYRALFTGEEKVSRGRGCLWGMAGEDCSSVMGYVHAKSRNLKTLGRIAFLLGRHCGPSMFLPQTDLPFIINVPWPAKQTPTKVPNKKSWSNGTNHVVVVEEDGRGV